MQYTKYVWVNVINVFFLHVPNNSKQKELCCHHWSLKYSHDVESEQHKRHLHNYQCIKESSIMLNTAIRKENIRNFWKSFVQLNKTINKIVRRNLTELENKSYTTFCKGLRGLYVVNSLLSYIHMSVHIQNNRIGISCRHSLPIFVHQQCVVCLLLLTHMIIIIHFFSFHIRNWN